MGSDTFTANRPVTSGAETRASATVLPFRRPVPATAPSLPASPTKASPAARVPSMRPDPASSAANNPEDAQARLVASLAKLQSALRDQRVAVAQWRGALDTLRGSLGTLGSGLENYRSRLTTLGQEVGQLNSQAHELERWADQVIAKTGTPEA